MRIKQAVNTNDLNTGVERTPIRRPITLRLLGGKKNKKKTKQPVSVCKRMFSALIISPV